MIKALDCLKKDQIYFKPVGLTVVPKGIIELAAIRGSLIWNSALLYQYFVLFVDLLKKFPLFIST